MINDDEYPFDCLWKNQNQNKTCLAVTQKFDKNKIISNHLQNCYPTTQEIRC
jgi:hypothetical protein